MKKMKNWLSSLVVAMALSPIAFAGTSCETYSKLLNGRPCECSENLTGKYTLGLNKLVIEAPANMPLVAACNYSEEEWGGDGIFFFKGHSVVKGTFWKSRSEDRGKELVFGAIDAKSSRFLPKPSDIVHDFRVAELPGGKVLTLDKKSNTCRMVDATILITDIEFIADAGTDNGGAYLTGYKVLHLGKPSKCN